MQTDELEDARDGSLRTPVCINLRVTAQRSQTKSTKRRHTELLPSAMDLLSWHRDRNLRKSVREARGVSGY
jgi:hypothetical protein